MKRFDDACAARIKASVAAAEARSSAELVVRVVARSDDYRDVAWALGFAMVVAWLCVVIFSPWVFAPVWVVPEAVLLGAVGVALGWKVPAVARLFTTAGRRAREVRLGAQAAFYTEAVSATAGGTGVLVYCSVLEDSVVLIADFAIEGKAPGARWAEVGSKGASDGTDLVERLVAVIEGVGALGAEVAPRAADDVNELSDDPRIG